MDFIDCKTVFPAAPTNLNELQSLYQTSPFYPPHTFGVPVTNNSGSTSVIFASTELIESVLSLNPTVMHVDRTFTMVTIQPCATHMMTIHFEINDCDLGILECLSSISCFILNHCLIKNFSPIPLLMLKTLPVLYCLMETDDLETYKTVFNYIQENIFNSNFVPRKIFAEFNWKIMAPLSMLYTTAKITCSWFAYCQNLWQKVISVGYINTVLRDSNVSQCLKMLMVLPLLPADRIYEGYNMIHSYSVKCNIDLSRLFDFYSWYWLVEYIGRHNLSMSRERTNNNIENFHRQLMFYFQTSPSIWLFLCGIHTLNQTYTQVARMLKLGLLLPTQYRCQYSYDNPLIAKCKRLLMNDTMTVQEFLYVCSSTRNSYMRLLFSFAIRQYFFNKPFYDHVNDISRLTYCGRVTTDEEYDPVLEDYTAHQLHELQLFIERTSRLPLKVRKQKMERVSAQRKRLREDRHHKLQVWDEQLKMRDLHARAYAQTLAKTEYQQALNSHGRMAPDDVSSDSDDDYVHVHGFCMVCHTMKYQKKYILIPCGHAWLCHSCRHQQLDACPMCREEVSSYTLIRDTSI